MYQTSPLLVSVLTMLLLSSCTPARFLAAQTLPPLITLSGLPAQPRCPTTATTEAPTTTEALTTTKFGPPQQAPTTTSPTTTTTTTLRRRNVEIV